jgi:hypothetical protein
MGLYFSRQALKNTVGMLDNVAEKRAVKRAAADEAVTENKDTLVENIAGGGGVGGMNVCIAKNKNECIGGRGIGDISSGIFEVARKRQKTTHSRKKRVKSKTKGKGRGKTKKKRKRKTAATKKPKTKKKRKKKTGGVKKRLTKKKRAKQDTLKVLLKGKKKRKSGGGRKKKSQTLQLLEEIGGGTVPVRKIDYFGEY